MDTMQVIWIIIAAAGLWLLWMISSKLGDISSALSKIKTQLASLPQQTPTQIVSPVYAAPESTRPIVQHCRLVGVDEETAAIIMAIVTDRNPDETLKFISITAI